MSSEQDQNLDQITIPLVIQFLAGLSAKKLPTQTQFSNILLATLNSPIFDSNSHSENQPDLVRSLARFLVILRKFTDLNNEQNQFQRLFHALMMTHSDQYVNLPSIQTLPTTSSIDLFKRFLLSSLELPNRTIQIIDKGIKLFILFFQKNTLQPHHPAIENSQVEIDRWVTELVTFIVDLRQHLAILFKNQSHYILTTLSQDLQTLEIKQELWDIINLLGQCLSGFFGASVYWHQLPIPCNELLQLFTQRKEEFIKPLQKLQALVLHLFMDNFEQQVYSPKLYDELRLIVQDLRTYSRFITKPTMEILGILQAMRLRAVEADQPWRELIEAFQQVSSDIHSINLDSLPRQAAGSVAKATFNQTIEYLIPRLLLLMNEIPSPRIEFVSPTIDAVFDPASFTSTSGFMPSSMLSTTVLRVEINNKSFQDVIRVSPNPFFVKTSTKQRISILGLRILSKNVGFYFHKKVDEKKNFLSKSLDFTRFEDEGKLDLFLGMGSDDGLSLDFDLDWSPYRRRCHHANELDGLFTIENFKVGLKGFGIFPHDTNHPILNWFLKPGLEPYLHAKLIHVLEEYLLDQVSKLNNLLGRMRCRWEEAVDSGLGGWETFLEVIKILNSSSTARDETEQQPSNSQIDSTGLTITAEDGSYVIRIGMGQKILPGKGVGGPGKFKERLGGIIRDEVGLAIDTPVNQIATGIALATLDANRPGWQSDLFDLDRKNYLNNG